jgi:hypothetical protein
MGADTSLSKVFTLLSVGITIGPIEEELNNMVIDISPGMRVAAGAFFPTANERNMKRGNSTPNMRVPGLM